MKRALCSALVAGLAAFTVGALASPIQETLIHQGVPTAQNIKTWSAQSGVAKNFLFLLDADPDASLANVTQISNSARIQVSTTVYPTTRSLPTWQALAAKDVHFVVMTEKGYFPTTAEAAMINKVGFKYNVITLTAFPQDAADVQGLKSLTVPFSLNFAAGRYPSIADLSVMQLIPTQGHFQYITDYWPRGAHTSVFNLLQQQQSLGISDQIPTADDLSFMAKIERLENLNLEYSNAEVPAGTWTRISAALPTNPVHVRWTSRDRVPGARELKEFFGSAREGDTRSFVLDRDQDLAPDERATLEAASGSVEWIHESQ